jgi:hypothetical protein
MEAGLIRPNHSEFGSPILLARKPYGLLRLCIEYRGLNEVTRKDAYPLPRVDDTLDELKDANILTHLNLALGFRQVQVRDKDVHKTAFKTHDSLLEWVAMPFGMCNAPATFLRMMNDILCDFLHKFVTVLRSPAARPRRGGRSQARRHPLTSPWWALETPQPCHAWHGRGLSGPTTRSAGSFAAGKPCTEGFFGY